MILGRKISNINSKLQLSETTSECSVSNENEVKKNKLSAIEIIENQIKRIEGLDWYGDIEAYARDNSVYFLEEVLKQIKEQEND